MTRNPAPRSDNAVDVGADVNDPQSEDDVLSPHFEDLTGHHPMSFVDAATAALTDRLGEAAASVSR
jgi:hypothetical protein